MKTSFENYLLELIVLSEMLFCPFPNAHLTAPFSSARGFTATLESEHWLLCIIAGSVFRYWYNDPF